MTLGDDLWAMYITQGYLICFVTLLMCTVGGRTAYPGSLNVDV